MGALALVAESPVSGTLRFSYAQFLNRNVSEFLVCDQRARNKSLPRKTQSPREARETLLRHSNFLFS